MNTFGTGKGADTLTSGLEGAWTNEPTKWDNGYLDNLYNYDYELTTSPAGAQQWTPKDPEAQDTVPDAHDPSKRHAPMMLTTDLALEAGSDLRADLEALPREPGPARRRVRQGVVQAAAPRHGPVSRYLGPWVPEPQLWQDPVPAVDHDLIGDDDIAALKRKILDSGLSISQLVSTAWASAASFRGTDKRGGANGARIRLAPQKDWEVNEPAELAKVLQTLEQIQQDFNGSQSGGNEGLARRPDRARRLRGRRTSGEERRPRRHGPVRAGAHGRLAGADRRRVVRGARTDRRRLPQLPPAPSEKLPPEQRAAGPGQPA